jgi:quercetin dioxygenase-like cupin family protein
MKRQFFFCLIATLLAAQAVAPEVELSAEPHHHLTLENKYVRVYNVEVPPHSDTLMHWHRHDYIYVTLGATEVVNEVKDKPPATIKLQDGDTRFSPAPFAHIASNRTDQPFRNVTIEIADDEALRQATTHWDEDRALETFPGGTQQILFVKDGIRASEFELQPGGEATISPGPYLLVALSDLELLQTAQNAPVLASMGIRLKPGEVQWVPSPHRRSLTHRGPPVKFVTLEFP